VTGFDYLVLAIIGISAVLGFMRGLIKEVLSLIAYIAAFVAALWWGPSVSLWLGPWVSNDLLRVVLAYGCIFILVLLLVGLVNVTLSALIDRTGLTPADSGMGVLFGLLRGLLFVLILVGLAGHTPLINEAWWKNSALAPLAVHTIQQIKPMLPPAFTSWLPY
jgi:membrane protein required for colicin V production